MYPSIPGIGQILVFLSGAKWFYAILRNWGVIKKSLVDVEGVIKNMLEKKDTLPSCDDTKKLLDVARVLFESGLIDFPGVEEKDVARVLQNIENNLICEIEKVGGP